jgi:hypothetical protein
VTASNTGVPREGNDTVTTADVPRKILPALAAFIRPVSLVQFALLMGPVRSAD